MFYYEVDLVSPRKSMRSFFHASLAIAMSQH